MEKIKEELLNWFTNFINNKNALLNNLEEIQKNKEGFDLKITYTDKESYAIIEPFINKDTFGKIEKDKFISLVVYNSKDNLNMLIDNWKVLIELDKLTIYFVNMFSETDTKWVIRPCMHNKIAEESSLTKGLKSIFNTVESTNKERVERFIRNKSLD
jgi:hypothetical protein